mmetsp:Transcript_68080/g.129592  ORF Transcript_68080/g.129592 Transcript_68080/m.129592 type:complete len:232 (-) Transcript_68080:1172-1867(-)
MYCPGYHSILLLLLFGLLFFLLLGLFLFLFLCLFLLLLFLLLSFLFFLLHLLILLCLFWLLFTLLLVFLHWGIFLFLTISLGCVCIFTLLRGFPLLRGFGLLRGFCLFRGLGLLRCFGLLLGLRLSLLGRFRFRLSFFFLCFLVFSSLLLRLVCSSPGLLGLKELLLPGFDLLLALLRCFLQLPLHIQLVLFLLQQTCSHLLDVLRSRLSHNHSGDAAVLRPLEALQHLLA